MAEAAVEQSLRSRSVHYCTPGPVPPLPSSLCTLEGPMVDAGAPGSDGRVIRYISVPFAYSVGLVPTVKEAFMT